MNPVQSDATLAYLECLGKDIKTLIKTQEITNILALANNPSAPENIRQQCLNSAMAMMGLLEPSNALASDYISDDEAVTR